ncbi:MAG: hypothetical protein AAF514_11790 [Verrucomicrobiota bacterium]
MESKTGVRIDTAFYWPKPPSGFTAGYTAPLVGWEETTIAGLKREPFVLRGYWSQTYRPEHHNFTERFLFESELEADLPQGVRSELRANDVRMIYFHSRTNDPIRIIGFDGTIRTLP